MRAGLKQFAAGAVAVGVIFFAGCNSSPTPAASDTPAAAAPAGPPPLVSAQTAFSPMYKAAITWASDAELIRMTAKEVPGFKNEGGKAAMWEAGFGSPSKHQFRVYSYSIATVLPSNIHKGVDPELPLPWGGETRDAMPVETASFNVDSDAAYKTAAGDAAEWLSKNPTKALTALELGNTSKFNSPVWYVSWGDKKSGGYVALVDATSGKVYKAKS
jgi:hypothetical protein